MGCETETVDLLRETGHKMTPQRMMILTSLRHASGHMTAADIFERVKAEYVDQVTDEQLIRPEGPPPDRRDRYGRR